jgi:hypothetical protein
MHRIFGDSPIPRYVQLAEVLRARSGAATGARARSCRRWTSSDANSTWRA